MARDAISYNEYMNDYMKRRYHARREEAFEILGGSCVKCGREDMFEIDHIDPAQKELDIAKLWSVSKERFLNELKKCQLLCPDCHKEKTKIDNGVEHGGGLSGKRNCPCPLCRAKKNEYNKKYHRTHVRRENA
mgnify:CR=1 FL=1